jgi:hypothetical protein
MPLLLITNKILFKILLSTSTPYAEELLGIVSFDFEATGQLLVIYPAFVK